LSSSRRSPPKFDPFASDDPSPLPSWQASAKKSRSNNSTSTTSYNIQLPSTRSPTDNKSLRQHLPAVPLAPPKPDRNARARIVARILLNRIYAAGKPVRRRMAYTTTGNAYKKSCLSSVITVE
ncbi:hypothetical protein C8J56DRAFT_745533, partial [Mycena floridula]